MLRDVDVKRKERKNEGTETRTETKTEWEVRGEKHREGRSLSHE